MGFTNSQLEAAEIGQRDVECSIVSDMYSCDTHSVEEAGVGREASRVPMTRLHVSSTDEATAVGEGGKWRGLAQDVSDFNKARSIESGEAFLASRATGTTMRRLFLAESQERAGQWP